ncbi:acetylglutamate kinase [Klebsiella quasipneumoniae]|nr:acetylglutamate kinase [Klebsiella quasipneumoniae]
MNPLIIKLGGVLLDSEEALERLFTALVNYREAHQRPLIIVHGGGCVVDELMKQLNLPVQKKMACALRRLSKSTSSPARWREPLTRRCWRGRKSTVWPLSACSSAMAIA